MNNEINIEQIVVPFDKIFVEELNKREVVLFKIYKFALRTWSILWQIKTAGVLVSILIVIFMSLAIL